MVNLPRWSGDGSRITFGGIEPGKSDWRIYTIARDGCIAEPLTAGPGSQVNSSWGLNDGAIVFSQADFVANTFAIQVQDLKTGKVSELPGPQGLKQPLWSPDGRFVAALGANYHRLLIFEWKARKWSEAPSKNWDIGDYHFSHDSKYIFAEDTTDATVHRYDIATSAIQRMASFKDLRRPTIPYWSFWFGLAPDDSILTMRDLGTHEIYSFDIEK